MSKPIQPLTTANEAPRSLISQCRATTHGIVRTKGNPAELTLLEYLEQGRAANHFEAPAQMDVCHIDSFIYDPASGEGTVTASVSLIERSPHIAMYGQLVDLASGKVLGALPDRVDIEDAAACQYTSAFILNAHTAGKDLAVLVDIDWERGGEESHVVLERDYGDPVVDLDYEHYRPQKEKKYVTITLLEGTAAFGETPGKQAGNEANIVISFVREPADTSDLDYLLLGKRGPHNNPNFGVPGRGVISMANGSIDMSRPITGKCYVKQVGGSGGTGLYYDVEYDKSVFTQFGDSLRYDMALSWKQEFMAAGSMKHYLFDYHLEINASFKTSTGRIVDVCVVVTSSKLTQERVQAGKTLYIYIPRLEIMWGCMAAGTPIAMLSGSKNIEDIRIGDSVLGADGEAWQVRNTWTGEEYLPMVRLRCENGSGLLLTQNHVVLTDEGLLPAVELTAAMRVADGQGGWQQLASVEQEVYEGTVHNLDILRPGGEDPHQHLLLAGGVVVGDNQLQNHLERSEAAWANC